MMIIYAGEGTKLSWVFTNKLATSLGKISYSIFIIRYTVIVFYTYTFTYSKLDTNLTKFYIFVITIILAILIHKFIENPFRFRKYEFKKDKIIILIKYLLAGILISSIAYTVIYYKGFTQRVDEKYLVMQAKSRYRDIDNLYITKYKKEPDLILLGSSHALRLGLGIKGFAKAHHLTVLDFSASACNQFPLLQLPVGSKKSGERCKLMYDKFTYFMSKHPNTTVIISQFTTPYINDTSKTTQPKVIDNAKYIFLKDLILSNYNDIKDNKSILIPKLADKYFLPLINPKTKIILLADNPAINIKSSQVFNKPFISNNYFSQLVVPKTKKRNVGNQILKDYASKHNNFYYIDGYTPFCNTKTNLCTMYDKNTKDIYLTDRHHLSIEGSKFLISKIESQLLTIIKKPVVK